MAHQQLLFRGGSQSFDPTSTLHTSSPATTSYSPLSVEFEFPNLDTSTPLEDISIDRRHVGSTGKGILIGMLAAFGSALVVILILGLIYFFRYTSKGRIFLDRIGRPGEYDDEQAFVKEEAEALESMNDLERSEYMRAKAFIESNPPESAQTDISLGQFLAIQEKGVSAWEFEPELEIANCFVEGRTEIEFFDTECSVQSNLPVPKQNEVYYWEAKIYDKPESTSVGIGMSTKPYPLFRIPGYHRTSVAYLSPGHRRFNQPFSPTANYGPSYVRGDVIGVGYRPRTGTVFFTRNGKKLDDITHSLKTQNLFPTVGANGPCSIHVNFGQMGFVFIEANVKKWGLAPMTGSLAPPPPYGSEAGSILLEGGQAGVVEGQAGQGYFLSPGSVQHGRSRSATMRLSRQHPTSPGPQRSPTDISLTQLERVESNPYDLNPSSVADEAHLLDLAMNDDEEDDIGEGASSHASSLVGSSSMQSRANVGYADIPADIFSNPTAAHSAAGLGLIVEGDLPPPEYESPESASDDGNVRRGSSPTGRRKRGQNSRSGSSPAVPQERYRDDPDAAESDDGHEEGRPSTAYRDDPDDASDFVRLPPRSSSLAQDQPNQSRRKNNGHDSPPIPSYEVAVGRNTSGSGN